MLGSKTFSAFQKASHVISMVFLDYSKYPPSCGDDVVRVVGGRAQRMEHSEDKPVSTLAENIKLFPVEILKNTIGN